MLKLIGLADTDADAEADWLADSDADAVMQILVLM